MSPEMEKEIFTSAGEYLLGTLEGDELRRFQAIKDSPEAQEALRYWEERLGTWSLAATPVDPPNRIWNAIELQLDKGESSGGLFRNFWGNIRVWRPVALAAVAAALALFFVYRQPTQLPTPTTAPMVALLGAEDQAPQFLMAAYPGEHKAMIRVLRPMDVPEDKSLELWMVPGEGQVPISWGLLPTQGERSMIITDREMPFMKSGSVFAISMEPRGGSTIAGPSGPVMYQGKLQKI